MLHAKAYLITAYKCNNESVDYEWFMWDAACKRQILHTKRILWEKFLLIGDHLVQSCMILALTAVLRRSIAHGSINVEFIKGLVQYKF